MKKWLPIVAYIMVWLSTAVVVIVSIFATKSGRYVWFMFLPALISVKICEDKEEDE